MKCTGLQGASVIPRWWLQSLLRTSAEVQRLWFGSSCTQCAAAWNRSARKRVKLLTWPITNNATSATTCTLHFGCVVLTIPVASAVARKRLGHQ